MGYKILDVKTEIHEDVEKYMEALKHEAPSTFTTEQLRLQCYENILDIVDKHFEKIER
jgi:hypothetical protein